MILELFEKEKQKGYNEIHGIVFIVFFFKHWDNIPSAAIMDSVQEWLLFQSKNWDKVGECCILNYISPEFKHEALTPKWVYLEIVTVRR